MKTIKTTEEELPDKFEVYLNDQRYLAVVRYFEEPHVEVFDTDMNILGASKIPEGSWYIIRENGVDLMYLTTYSSNKNDIRLVFSYAEKE